MENISWWSWLLMGGMAALILLFFFIWAFNKPENKPTEGKMEIENTGLWNDIKAEFHTLVLTLFYKAKSATFWIAVLLIVRGLQMGGIEGMILAALSSLGYTGKEAYQNVQFGKIKANGGNTKTTTTVASVAPQINEKQVVAPTPPNPSEILPPVPQSFDVEAFDKLVEEKANTDYLEANDITRYFAAQDKFNSTQWADEYHFRTAQDYLVNKAQAAFEYKFGYPYAEAEKHLADDKKCPYYSVANMARQMGIDYWYMLRMVEKTFDVAGVQYNDWAGQRLLNAMKYTRS